jgi:transcription antitermination factor NusG
MNQNWYVVYTRPCWEKKVVDILSRKNITNYCPLKKIVRQRSDSKKPILEPLFTSYVFVRTSENQLEALKQINGINSFLYWLTKPAIIKDLEIKTIRHFLDEHSNVKLERVLVNANDIARLINGSLMNLEGNVVAINKTIKVILPSLGYMMTAEITPTGMEVIKPERIKVTPS